MQNSLTGVVPASSNGVSFINLGKQPGLLLGTNAASVSLAIAVSGLDCLETGVRPDLRLVSYNRVSNTILHTLVQFDDVVPLYIGDTSLILQATGFGGDGVIAAQVQARITFTYDPCGTNNTTTPVSVQITPLGYIKPLGATASFVGAPFPFIPDSADLVIIGGNTNFIVALNANGTTAATTCDITLNQTNLNFGDVLVGSNSTLSVQIRNNGSSPCTVSNITQSGSSYYTVSAPPFISLGVGLSTSISVQFTPLSATAEDATFILPTSDPDAPIEYISVTGTGIVAASTCDLTVTPSTLAFPTLQIGASTNLSAIISNAGNAVCTVDMVTVVTNGPDFTILAPAPSTTIAPGTSLVVQVTYTPSTTNASQGTVEIFSPGSTPLSLLNLTGNSEFATSSLAFPPSVDFGAVALGGTRTQTVTISNTGVTNLNITALTIANTDFSTASFTTNFPLAVGGSTNLTVVFTPTAAGPDDGTIFFSNDNPLASQTIGLTGLGVTPTPACSISVTNAVNFGAVAVGQTNTVIVNVSDGGLSNCAVESLTLTGSSAFGLIAPLTPFPVNVTNLVQLAVTYIPSGVTNDSGTLTMITDDPVNSQIDIALSGSGAVPVLVVNTNALDFGNVPVGSNSEISVTVSNTSAVQAYVNSISISGGEFVLDPAVTTASFSVNPGAANVVAVQFTPTQQGAETGTLQINSTGAVVPTNTVSLSGTGTQCSLSVEQTALNFGSVALGTTNILTVTINNSGNSTCTVDSVTIGGNGQFFAGPVGPFTIAGGTNEQVDVQYVPVNAQTIVILGGSVRGTAKPITVTH